jgi:hypothetical protein
MTQKATVGRIVHYYDDAKFDDANNGAGKGPYAALVAQVFPDGPYANLKVFVPFGDDFYAGSVAHKNDSLGGSSRYWVWPPRD